jgi:hypothetical protein
VIGNDLQGATSQSKKSWWSNLTKNYGFLAAKTLMQWFAHENWRRILY